MGDYNELLRAIEDLGCRVKEIERMVRSLYSCQIGSQGEAETAVETKTEDTTDQEAESTDDAAINPEVTDVRTTELNNHSILNDYNNEELFDALQDLAHRAGGKLIQDDTMEDNEPIVAYIRCSKLKIATLSRYPNIYVTSYRYGYDRLWNGVRRDNYIYRNRYRLFARIPYDYQLLRRILERDVELYAALSNKG